MSIVIVWLFAVKYSGAIYEVLYPEFCYSIHQKAQ